MAIAGPNFGLGESTEPGLQAIWSFYLKKSAIYRFVTLDHLALA